MQKLIDKQEDQELLEAECPIIHPGKTHDEYVVEKKDNASTTNTSGNASSQS